jgi:hypothetical protein
VVFPTARVTARSWFRGDGSLDGLFRSVACPAACLTARLAVRFGGAAARFGGVPGDLPDSSLNGPIRLTRLTVRFGGVLGVLPDISLSSSVQRGPSHV